MRTAALAKARCLNKYLKCLIGVIVDAKLTCDMIFGEASCSKYSKCGWNSAAHFCHLKGQISLIESSLDSYFRFSRNYRQANAMLPLLRPSQV